jgi:hypothetical protein
MMMPVPVAGLSEAGWRAQSGGIAPGDTTSRDERGREMRAGFDSSGTPDS